MNIFIFQRKDKQCYFIHHLCQNIAQTFTFLAKIRKCERNAISLVFDRILGVFSPSLFLSLYLSFLHHY